MLFDQIHHIAIIGTDYAASRHFYVDLLGFRVIRENFRQDRGDYKIDLACGTSELELFIVPNAPARPSYPEAQGLRHLAFRVDDIQVAVFQLKSRGIECEPIRWDTYTQRRFTFFHDPDGLPLELHE